MKRSTLVRDPKAGANCYTFQPAGWSHRFGKVDVGINRCAHIDDGVSFDLASCEDPNKTQWVAGGVIAFRDLEAIYFAAKAARFPPNGTAESAK